MVPTSAEWWLVNESFVFCLRRVENRFERSEPTEPSGRAAPDGTDVSGSAGLDLRPRDRSHKARTVDAVRVAWQAGVFGASELHGRQAVQSPGHTEMTLQTIRMRWRCMHDAYSTTVTYLYMNRSLFG